MKKIPIKVAHYGRFDPRVRTGGVETFARNLQIVFEEVEFLTPEAQNPDAIIASKPPVVWDTQMVSDWSLFIFPFGSLMWFEDALTRRVI